MFASVWRHQAGGPARERSRDAQADALALFALGYSPRVERVGEEGTVFDVTGLERLFGGPSRLARHLADTAAARGWACGVAIVRTRTTALMLARAGTGETVVPAGDEARALARLPLVLLAWADGLERAVAGAGTPAAASRAAGLVAGNSASSPRRSRATVARTLAAGSAHHYRMAPLPQATPSASGRDAQPSPRMQLPGHGRASSQVPVPPAAVVLLDTLSRWGLSTIGEFAALPRGGLHGRLGEAGVRWHRLAHGEDLRPLVRDVREEPYQQSLALDWPIEGLEPLSFALARLLDPLADRLARRDRGAVGVRVWLRLVTRAVHARYLPLPAPMRDPKILRTLLLLDLESHPPPAGIDEVTITLDVAPGRVLQRSLLTRPLPSPDSLSTLLARLTALMGERSCGQPEPADTHRPGAFIVRPFAPEGASSGVGPVTRGSASRLPGPRLADEGERHEAQGEPAAVLRRFRGAVPARVRVDARGWPVHVAARQAQVPGSAVLQCAGPWRTSGAWWRAPVPAGGRGGPWDREEWDVAIAHGGVYRLSRDVATGAWVMEGYWD